MTPDPSDANWYVRTPGESILSGKRFKNLSLIKKLSLAVKYGNKLSAYADSIINNPDDNSYIYNEAPWYTSKEKIDSLEITRIYNNLQKYANFIVKK